MKPAYIDMTCALTWLFSALALLFLIKYNWSRRWLYYYGSKINGPFAWPIIGSAHHFIGGQKVFYKNMIKLFETQPSIFKFWLGKDLIVVTSRPEDVETVLSNCFGKPKFYDYSYKLFRDGLLIAPAKIWKDRRKTINPTFNPKILNSFIDIFGKHANRLVDVFEEGCGKESFDVFLKLFRSTLDIACETLADVDSDLIKGQDAYLQKAIRMEDVLAIRSFSVWLHPDIVWNNSSFGKEVEKASPEVFGFIKQILGLKKLYPVPTVSEEFTLDDEFCKKKRFLNHLLTASETNPQFNELAVEEETQTILITGSETTAITIGMVLIILGIYPEVQEKIMDELELVLGPDNREITLDDINKMEYMERVIKETLRVLPIVPIILRSMDEDIKLGIKSKNSNNSKNFKPITDPYIIPTGSFVLVPIGHIGKKPEFWKEPNKFDPDRFLPENNTNRHRCTFIPFSYGARNCVGFKYGMMSMKVLLAAILNKYIIKPAQYKSLEEIELIFGMVTKPKHGFKIKLERKI
ncbi:cytochrome P450 4C1-like isoform X1 [Tribolium madens]|uniref:cytochrome P450 4C1-like isoform X1 n=1 Tax=Tribolium madens TaxID=41895 RepID=UPI001CF72999|nr:cytochrome P450 4C1-like isoform X1 [Tribolium madens]